MIDSSVMAFAPTKSLNNIIFSLKIILQDVMIKCSFVAAYSVVCELAVRSSVVTNGVGRYCPRGLLKLSSHLVCVDIRSRNCNLLLAILSLIYLSTCFDSVESRPTLFIWYCQISVKRFLRTVLFVFITRKNTDDTSF